MSPHFKLRLSVRVRLPKILPRYRQRATCSNDAWESCFSPDSFVGRFLFPFETVWFELPSSDCLLMFSLLEMCCVLSSAVEIHKYAANQF